MGDYEGLFKEALEFTEEYRELIDCHLVDFFTENLWEKCIPVDLRKELDTEDTSMGINGKESLKRFMELTESFPKRTTVTEIDDIHGTTGSIKTQIEENKGASFMSPKKKHEVEILGNIVGRLATSKDCLILDAGAGKAYLSTYISDNYKIPVLAVDSSTQCHAGALSRQEKLRKKQRSTGQLRYVVQEINESTDYERLERDCFGKSDSNLLVTGLHTCGSLAHSIIKAFLNNQRMIVLLIVPCCYHLTDETLCSPRKFSRNARMLAQQSVERSTRKEICVSLFYRSVLEVVLKSIGAGGAKIGRGGPKEDFLGYATWALHKIGIEPSKMPTKADLRSIYESYEAWKKRFDLFQTLRIRTGSVIEIAILLDRIIYLQKTERCSSVSLLRIFEPSLSPRNYAIFAVK